MSSAMLSSDSKLESAVYIFFGIALSLSIFRLFAGHLFLDARIFVASISITAPIIGALFYYWEPERAIETRLQRLLLRKHGEFMEQFIVMKRIVYQVWKIAIREKWETPTEETRFLISTIVRGPDFHNEIWRRKSAVYFIFAVPLILYSIEFNPLTIICFTFAIGALVILPFRFWDTEFPFWLCLVALYKSLQETQSLVKARIIGSLQFKRTNADLISTIDPILGELNELVVKREWERFQRRFEYIIEEFEEETIRSQLALTDYYIESLLQVHKQRREIERQRYITQTKSIRMLIREITTRKTLKVEQKLEDALNQCEELIQDTFHLFNIISEYDMVSRYVYDLEQASTNLVNSFPEKVTPEFVSQFLKWFNDGHDMFGKIAINAAGILDDPKVSQVTLRAIIDSGKSDLWRYIIPSMAKELVNMTGIDAIEAQVSVLGTGKPDLVAAIIAASDIVPPQIAEVVILLVDSHDRIIQTSIQNMFGQMLFNLENTQFEVVYNGLLQNPSVNVRNLALILLIRLIEEQRIKPAIVNRLLSILEKPKQDSNPDIRKAVVNVLVQIKSKKVESILEDIAENDPDSDVKQHANQALKLLDAN